MQEVTVAVKNQRSTAIERQQCVGELAERAAFELDVFTPREFDHPLFGRPVAASRALLGVIDGNNGEVGVEGNLEELAEFVEEPIGVGRRGGDRFDVLASRKA
ncbi:hypothetical protein [Bradyrhizobium algeriense]|uniref:hypothetical protein n=1 Tax=Bradyrhizobium algeriense TaxID=634784 RepID=UPI000D373EE8|nr:hypothetical protein [Bradyrhizobium algeriense]